MVERCRRWKNNNRVSAYLFWSYLSYVISLIFGALYIPRFCVVLLWESRASIWEIMESVVVGGRKQS